MALINCTECSRKISSKLQSCLGCGMPTFQVNKISATGSHIETIQKDK